MTLPKIALSDTWRALRRIARILWVRVALISVLSLAAALLAPLLEGTLPEGWSERFSQETTLPILNVLASSLLAVATFALGIMVSSHRALADQTTPRVHQILMEDSRTQTVIATFVGGFVYSLSCIILFRAQVFQDKTAVVVFLISLVVVLIIVLSLIRWIEHLSRIGSLSYALDQAELSAERVLGQLRERPRYGGAGHHNVPDDGRDDGQDDGQDGREILAPRSGFVLRMNMSEMQECAERDGCRVVIEVLPGDTVLRGSRVGRLRGPGEAGEFAGHIVIGKKRSHDDDPRYALSALQESASKALSPGINDPGTAIEVVARLERLLWEGFAPLEDRPEVAFDRVHLREIPREALLAASYRQIARDGQGEVEVIGRVAAAVRRVSERLEDKKAVETLMAEVDAYAEQGLITEGDRRRYAAFDDREIG